MRKLLFSVALAVSVTAPVAAQSLTEVAPMGTPGLWAVASPLHFSGANSGTYYYPSVIEKNGYAFLFTQGGQFASTSPFTPHCDGDKTLLWRAPLTHAGLRASFTPLRIVSRCDSDATYRVHWTFTNAYFSPTLNKVLIVSERQQLKKSDNSQVSSSIWLLQGTFNALQTDIPSWTYTKLFETDPVTPNRIESFSLTRDTVRPVPSDGFTHDFYRGFARVPANSTTEWRLDISPKHCATSLSCTLVEFWKNGTWLSVVNDTLNFTPDVVIPSFRPGNIVQRNGQMELWGAGIIDVASSTLNCPCNDNKASAQVRWYSLSSSFARTGPYQVFSNIRCMPAEPHTHRMGAEIVVLSDGTQYLFSGRNDDKACGDPNPFVGQDTVTTILQ